ncbi:uncharacterized protein Bfra_005442 [Botrytis fragariae]|uniref:Uncharacterized protein n=1 Tax=Botrytis fragariae TaxID=1964551 RepID=A0A8H6EJA9_9HELO|nr:uncharacterized protein Bfra_005442 [Botrytis fragariae]KAF5873975.1 hypothetical protein Bfra_005442 [Botrytis fragariae]
MLDTTPAALAVIKPHNTDALSVINLAEEFQRLQHECVNIFGVKFEQAIQSKLLEQRKALIRHLESMFSEINGNPNRKIRETNAKFGLTLPLEELKKVSASDIAEHDRGFITAERERVAIQKKHLKERLEEIKLEISSALGITVSADPSSLSQPTESSDDKAAISQPLEDNRFFQNELDDSKQTLIKLKAEKKQDKTIIDKLQTRNHKFRPENATLKEELKQLEEKVVHHKVVANSCSRVRHGSSHTARHFRDDDGFHDIKGRAPADRKVNDARNDACHKGDIATDFALFKIDPDRAGWNIGGGRYVDFTNSHRVTPHEWGTIYSLSEAGPDRVILEVLNSHATMYRCDFNTEYTHSPENDEAFNVLFAKFFDRFKSPFVSTNLFLSAKRYENLVIFVNQAVNDRRAMREIVGGNRCTRES